MENKNYKERKIVIEVSAVFIFLVYGLFFYDSFTSDQVAGFYYGQVNYPADPWWTYITSGRFMGYVYCVINWLLNFAHISKLYREWPMQLLFMIFLIITIHTLYDLYGKYLKINKKEVILPIIIGISFVNPFFVECFTYVGYELGFGIMLAAFAVRRIDRGSKKDYALAIFYMIISISTYQVFFELFLIWSTMYIYLKAEGKISKQTVIEFVKVVAVVAVAVAVVLGLTKGVASLSDDYTELNKIASQSEGYDEAASGNSVVLPSFIRAYTTVLLTGFSAFPHNFLLLVIVLTIIIAVCALLENRRDVNSIVQFVLLMIAMNVYYVAIFFSGYDGLVQRVLWPFFACHSCMLMTILYHASREMYCEGKSYMTILTLITAFVLYNTFITQSAVTDFQIANKIDRQIAGEIQAEIKFYEEETGVEITKISVYNMGYKQYVSPYLNLKATGSASYNRRATNDIWCDVELLNYLYWEHYEELPMSEDEMLKYFGDENPEKWYTFMASRQLAFDGDTLYWYVY